MSRSPRRPRRARSPSPPPTELDTDLEAGSDEEAPQWPAPPPGVVGVHVPAGLLYARGRPVGRLPRQHLRLPADAQWHRRVGDLLAAWWAAAAGTAGWKRRPEALRPLLVAVDPLGYRGWHALDLPPHFVVRARAADLALGGRRFAGALVVMPPAEQAAGAWALQAAVAAALEPGAFLATLQWTAALAATQPWEGFELPPCAGRRAFLGLARYQRKAWQATVFESA
jgi:hypothetical protein